jgi:small-conductance mechanosensitive channel
MERLRAWGQLGVALMMLGLGTLLCTAANAEEQEVPLATGPASSQHVAPVRVDGVELFKLRGISSMPAETRAQRVRERILAAARNPQLDPNQLSIRSEADRAVLSIGNTELLTLIEADAHLEDVSLNILAEVVQARVIEAMLKYREDRSPDALKVSALYFAGLSLVLALLVWALKLAKARLDVFLQTRVASGLETLERKSFSLVRGGQLWAMARGLVNLFYVLTLLTLAYFYLNSVLGAFPYTRSYALWLLDMVMEPLASLGHGVLAAIPNLVFLTVLFLIVRYVLRSIEVFFKAIQRRAINLDNFDADWAMPTFRIARVVIIAFALVVAYPYIPGSDSAAFKGVSLFLGVVVSLGSTSFISNMIAGLTMTYRGAYRQGDWVRIGDEEGQVEEVRNMVMRLRTRKNESVTIPNSLILNSNVTNYSQQLQTGGLILHTVVGIGYDTPWRQVEAMLLEAARRTEGVMQEPPPFVLQKLLGDFAVSYELNVHVMDAARVPRYYSDLHRHIQDVFSENKVQIMSPAYENDPAEPKIAALPEGHKPPA